VASESMC